VIAVQSLAPVVVDLMRQASQVGVEVDSLLGDLCHICTWVSLAASGGPRNT